MQVNLFRRRLLRGADAVAAQLRPPHALQENGFADRCNRCNACITACPTRIIRRGDGGFPTVDFARGECTFCDACVASCTTGALSANEPLTARHAAIGQTCLAQSNVVCRSCGDRCDARAIRFPPLHGAAAVPVTDDTLCTGCGACLSACPVSAITLQAAVSAALNA